MQEQLGKAIRRALDSAGTAGPTGLLSDVRYFQKNLSLGEDELVDHLMAVDHNDEVRTEFHIRLSRWDSAEGGEWAAGTEVNTLQRRFRILELLEFTAESAAILNRAFPLDDDGTVVISEEWTPWYTEERAKKDEFYWPKYREVVEAKIGAKAAAELDRSTREVVKRLSDPTQDKAYQAKGLVMGHVQSGKTANFTGVIAKAVDSGYRLIIVLTGTMENLRAQTQRRIDMELVGRENVLGGIDQDNLELQQIQGVDYASTDDLDWPDKFVSYGRHPRAFGKPAIERLTRSTDDYKALRAGLAALDFRKDGLPRNDRPVYHPDNIRAADIRLVVVKKNSRVLKKLVQDLESTHMNLGEVPALIIDDEADQASVNTTRPKKDRPKGEETERTAINQRISDLLGLMPRAQYLAYTATPFANVFISPEDSKDIFPKDFIISLKPAPAYMGGKEFHDLELEPGEDRNNLSFEESNEKAYVRGLVAGPGEEDLRDEEIVRALDAFVLSGAIKLFREARGRRSKGWKEESGRFRHHTMLVHESMRQEEHKILAEDLRDRWASANYGSPQTGLRLAQVFEDDFLPVSLARVEEGEAIPESYGDLVPYVGDALRRIREGVSPVVVINGDKESDYNSGDADFLTRSVWKIIVGGQKLSRGFTVEGLTVSYYTRRTMAADTLMQMGRWFGYRSGYRDLIRLFMGRNVPAARKGETVDLYRAFEDIVRDEEDFRNQLAEFSRFKHDGKPAVRPMDVPPLVFQTSPWLRPTGQNKMYNAELAYLNPGDKTKDFTYVGDRNAGINENRLEVFARFHEAMTGEGKFFSVGFGDKAKASPYSVRYGILPIGVVREHLEDMHYQADLLNPVLTYLRGAEDREDLEDVVIFLPLANDNAMRQVEGFEKRLPILDRQRRTNGRDKEFSGSSTHHRLALEYLAGNAEALNKSAIGLDEYPDLRALRQERRGALMFTLTKDLAKNSEIPDGRIMRRSDVATLFHVAFPEPPVGSAPSRRVGFRVRKQGILGNEPIIDAPADEKNAAI